MSERSRLLVASVLIALAFGHGIALMAEEWASPTGYFDHGPLVPCVSAWLLFQDRRALGATPRAPHPGGPVLVALGLLALAIGVGLPSEAFEGLGLLLALAGTTLGLLGPAVLARASFPLAFLAFMVPWPRAYFDHLGAALKIASGWLTQTLLGAVGVASVYERGVIHMEGGASVEIVEGCAGLRGLVAIAAMAVLFAHLERARSRRILLVALIAPVAVLANATRLVAICLLARAGSTAAHEGIGHEAVGLVVYGFALLVFALVRSPAAAEEITPEPAPTQAKPRAGPVIAVIALLALGAAGMLMTARPPSGAIVTPRIPLHAGDWTGENTTLAPEIAALFASDDMIVRRYRRPFVPEYVELHVIHAQGNVGRAFGHPPEACFTNRGFVETERQRRALSIGGRDVWTTRSVYERRDEAHVVHTWYHRDGREIADVWEGPFPTHLDRLFGIRLEGEGTMIRVSTPILGPGDDPAERIRRFAAEALAVLLAPLP